MGLIIKNTRNRWPGNCLVYKWSAAISEEEKTKILQALNDWKATGLVRFIERTNQDRYITFVPDSSPLDGICSSSHIGMNNHEQFIKIDPTSGVGTIRHEIGHALGLYHEHKRRDRDTYVHWNQPETKDKYKHNFEKVDLAEAINVGSYDFDSLMHYGSAKSMSNDGNTALLTTVNSANQARIGHGEISSGDKTSAKELQKGNAQIFQLGINGQIESIVEQNNWTSGWTIARPYAIGTNNYILFLKTSNGIMHINRINFDGSIGEKIQSRDWTSGWTEAIKYNIGLFNFILLYKKSNGTVHTHRIDASGKIGEKVDEGRLDTGWTYASHFSIFLNNYILFSNKSGKVHIYEITWEGKIGQRKHAHNFSSDYTITQPFSVLGSAYLFMLKSSNGIMKIRKIKSDGKIGEIIQERNWTNGWTTSIPYSIGAFNFLLSIKKNDGTLHINRIDSDGTIGNICDKRSIQTDRETNAIYSVGLGTHLISIDPS